VRAEDHSDRPALEGEDLLARLGVPHLYRPAGPRSAGQAFAIRAEGHAVQVGGMLDRPQLPTRCCIPYLDHARALTGSILSVFAAGSRNAPAVRAKGNVAGGEAVHQSLEGEGEEFLAGLRIPQLYLP